MKHLLTVALLLSLTACATMTQARCFKEKQFNKLTVGMNVEQVADTMRCTPDMVLKGMDGEVVESSILNAHFEKPTFDGDNYIMIRYSSTEHKWRLKRVRATIVLDGTGVLLGKYFSKEDF